MSVIELEREDMGRKEWRRTTGEAAGEQTQWRDEKGPMLQSTDDEG